MKNLKHHIRLEIMKLWQQNPLWILTKCISKPMIFQHNKIWNSNYKRESWKLFHVDNSCSKGIKVACWNSFLPHEIFDIGLNWMIWIYKHHWSLHRWDIVRGKRKLMCTANLIGCMDRFLFTDLIQQTVTVTLNHPFIDSIIHSFINVLL